MSSGPRAGSGIGAALRRLVRVGPGLAVAAVAGFLVGSCGGDGGSALTTATGPALTATRPAVPTRTTQTVTTPVTTTVTEPATTAPAETVTTVETETTILPPRTSTETTATATEAEPASTSSTPWGWIVLVVALVAAFVLGIVLWRRRRANASAWSRRLADLTRRSLVALDDVLAEGSVVTGLVQALAGEARSLEAGAPDDRSRAAAAPLRARLDELADTLEADRTLRLGSTPPSTEQLSYSTALIHHQVEQLQGVLRPTNAGQSPA